MNCEIHLRLGGMSFLPIVLLLFSTVHAAFAQTTAFTYQGKLTDAGSPANATFDMQLKLFDTVDVGTGTQQGGTITNPTVQVTNGVFTVQLDFGAGVFDLGRDRFLEIGVRPAGNLDPYTILAPRQQVTSTPYTIRSLGAARADLATNSLQLEGLSASGFVQNTTSQQGANFNISGSGSIAGNLNVAGTLNGSASGLTNLNATNITSGTLDSARLGLIPASKGGTGLSTTGAAGNLLRSNGAVWASSPLQAMDVPGGSSNYVQNTISQQAGTTNFNISGNGTAAGTLSANLVNAANQYNIAGNRVLSIAGANNLFAGAGAGSANTGGGRNSFVGGSAGQANTTGVSNSFFGSSAGAANMSGSQNAFYGTFAGLANTASDNSFFGANAGSSNTSGTNNSFFGCSAGSSNTGGTNNSFFGRSAGLFTTSGFDNSFFGKDAGLNNTTGFQNSFFGVSAGSSNASGTNNSFFGRSAGSDNVSGSQNAFFGTFAGFVNTASDNSFFGSFAGSSNTDGADNSFFGRSAGSSNTSGKSNSFFGRGAGSSNTDGNDNSFFGYQAGNANSGGHNSFFGSFAGESNTTGDFNSFFSDKAGLLNTTGASNSFFGTDAGEFNTTGSNNSFFGVQAGESNTTGDNNTIIGRLADVGANNLTNATAIGYKAQVTQSNSLVLGSINGVNGATASVNVGIGTTAPVRTLTVNGRARVGDIPLEPSAASVCFNNAGDLLQCGASSLRWKSNVRPFLGGLDIVQRLRPITFNWKENGLPDVGLGAEDVAQTASSFVFTNTQGEAVGVRYDRLNMVLINAVKQQQRQITALQEQNAAMKVRLTSLEQKIERRASTARSTKPKTAGVKAAAIGRSPDLK